MTVSAYDPILKRTFAVPTQAILNAQVNHPKMVAWRASVKRREQEANHLNGLYGPGNLMVAHMRRTIRNLKRLERQQAAHG